MPEVVVQVKYTPDEFRDKILSKVPTRFKGQTLADVFDSLVKSLEKNTGMDIREVKSFVAVQFLTFLKQEGLMS